MCFYPIIQSPLYDIAMCYIRVEGISLKHVWSVAGCLYSSLAMHACGCLSADAPAFAD